MQLEPFYRVTFTTPESWSVTREGMFGTEGRNFLIAEGRAEGRLSARYRAANFPRRRVDGALEPEFRGVLETDDGRLVNFREKPRAQYEVSMGVYMLSTRVLDLGSGATLYIVK